MWFPLVRYRVSYETYYLEWALDLPFVFMRLRKPKPSLGSGLGLTRLQHCAYLLEFLPALVSYSSLLSSQSFDTVRNVYFLVYFVLKISVGFLF